VVRFIAVSLTAASIVNFARTSAASIFFFQVARLDFRFSDRSFRMTIGQSNRLVLIVKRSPNRWQKVVFLPGWDR